MTLNASRTGILFRCARGPHPSPSLEMELMLSGGDVRIVVSGTVTRLHPVPGDSNEQVVALTIDDHDFVRSGHPL